MRRSDTIARMLFESLLLSAVLLVVANVAYCFRRWATGVMLACAVFFVIGPLSFYRLLFGPFWLRPRSVLVLQAATLTCVLHEAAKRNWRSRSVLFFSTVVSLGVYSVMMIEPLVIHGQYASYREAYPFE